MGIYQRRDKAWVEVSGQAGDVYNNGARLVFFRAVLIRGTMTGAKQIKGGAFAFF